MLFPFHGNDTKGLLNFFISCIERQSLELMIKIIGAGFGRTGTLSLKVALERLGYTRCYHMHDLPANPEHITYWETAARGEPVNWPSLFHGYQAILDFPGCYFYRQLLDQYPHAKVILTTRDPEEWYASALKTIYKPKPSLALILTIVRKIPFSRRVRRLPRVMLAMDRIVFKGLFDGRFTDKQHALEVYKRHYEEVIKTVPPPQLLVYSVKEGWGPLCTFLEVSVPDKPFPHANTGGDFSKMELEFIRSL